MASTTTGGIAGGNTPDHVRRQRIEELPADHDRATVAREGKKLVVETTFGSPSQRAAQELLAREARRRGCQIDSYRMQTTDEITFCRIDEGGVPRCSMRFRVEAPIRSTAACEMEDGETATVEQK